MPHGNGASNASRERGKKRVSREEDYTSDDGFVANGSDPDNAPRSKKPKTESARSKLPSVIGSDQQYWELSGKRRVNVSEFKGKNLVNIREMYEKDGEMLPGRKGISLSIDQYNNLMLALPSIETALIAVGENVVRPDYRGRPAPAAKEEESGPLAEEKVEGAEMEGKKNFEATSEEE